MPPRKKKAASRDYHYLNVISSGPLVITHVPWPMPRWKDLLKGFTTIMQMHSMKRKDIVGIESLTYFGPDSTEDEKAWSPKSVEKDEALLVRLNAAFAGDGTVLPDFWLYRWNGTEFVLIREGK